VELRDKERTVPVIINYYDKYCSVCLLSTPTAAGKSILLGHTESILHAGKHCVFRNSSQKPSYQENSRKEMIQQIYTLN